MLHGTMLRLILSWYKTLQVGFKYRNSQKIKELNSKSNHFRYANEHRLRLILFLSLLLIATTVNREI